MNKKRSFVVDVFKRLYDKAPLLFVCPFFKISWECDGGVVVPTIENGEELCIRVRFKLLIFTEVYAKNQNFFLKKLPVKKQKNKH